MKSIRRYLRDRIVWGSSAILAAGSILLGLSIRHLDICEFDVDLETKARMLATLILHDGQSAEADFTGQLLPEFDTAENTEYFQFRFQDGTLIRRSNMLADHDLPFLPPNANGKPVLRNLRLPDGRRGRFIQLSFRPRAGNANDATRDGNRFRIPDNTDPASVLVVLGVARSREGLDALLLSVYLTLAAMDVLLVGLIALLVRRSLDKGFQPVAHLNAQIAGLSPDSLEKRIHLPDAPDEISTVPAALNRFVEALQAAFDRERRFTSNVAHELRTPVAEFRVACEVGAKWSDDPALVRRRFENLKRSAVDMERMLNGLLDLSRIDSGTLEVRSSDTRIAALVDACWARVCSDGGGSGHRLDNRIAPSLILNTDAVKLEMMVCNLLDNAACYSPTDSAVTCASRSLSDGTCEVCISNHAHALAREDLDHLFERFWRKESARTSGRHSGLGLSIVQALANALGIRISVALAADNLFTVSLLFPPRGAETPASSSASGTR